MIKKYGIVNAVPKAKKIDDNSDSMIEPDTKRGKQSLKIDFIATLLEILRIENDNNYKIVTEVMQKELGGVNVDKRKGFGGKTLLTKAIKAKNESD